MGYARKLAGFGLPRGVVPSPGASLLPNVLPPPTFVGDTNGPVYANAGTVPHYVKYDPTGDQAWRFRVGIQNSDNDTFFVAEGRSATSCWLQFTLNGVQSTIGGGRDSIGAPGGAAWGSFGKLQFQVNADGSIGLYADDVLVPGAFVTASEVAATQPVLGPYVYFDNTFGPLADDVEYGPLAPPLYIASAEFEVNSRDINLAITYTGTPDTYEYQLGLSGIWADVTVVSNAVAGVATLLIPEIAGSFEDEVRIDLRQKNDHSVTRFTSIIIPPPMILGVNDSGGTFYNDVFRAGGGWSDADIGYGAFIGEFESYAIPPGIPATATGAGATIKRSSDGTIFSTNGAGLTRLRWRYEFNTPAPEIGDYECTLAPGLTGVSAGNSEGITGWSYNSTTGKVSFSRPLGFAVFEVIFNVSSMPVGGIRISCYKVGVSTTYRAETLVSLPATFKMIRGLDISGVNNADANNRTYTALPTITMANRRSWNIDTFEAHTAKCLATNCGIYFNVKHVEADDVVRAGANYMATTMLANPWFKGIVSLSNEMWNFIFTQFYDSHLAGARLGFAVEGATPGTAVPETIMDGYAPRVDKPAYRGIWDGTTFTPAVYAGNHCQISQNFNDGDKVTMNGFGYACYRAVGFQPAGTVFYLGGDSNFAVHYDNNAMLRAQKRWIAHRLKQVITIYKEEFDLVGAPYPKFGLEAVAAQQVSYSIPIMDWENLYLDINLLLPGHYYGGGVAGKNTGNYADEGVTGYGKAQKDLLYSSGTLAAGIAAVKAIYASIVRPNVILPTVAAMENFSKDLRAYNISKGQPGGSITQGQYEINWHDIYENWPDAIAHAYPAAFNAATNYIKGDNPLYVTGTDGKAYILTAASSLNHAPPHVDWAEKSFLLNAYYTGSDGGVYRCTSATTGTQAPNVSFYALKVPASIMAAAAPSKPSQKLFEAIALSDEHGGDLEYLFTQCYNKVGGPYLAYNRQNGSVASNGWWGIFLNEVDFPNPRATGLANVQALIASGA